MSRAERTLLPQLVEHIRRIERPVAEHGVLSCGIAEIDRALPGGGLARGVLHEILGIGGDEEDGAIAAAFAAHILGQPTSPTSPSHPFGMAPPLSPPKGGEGWGEVGVISPVADGMVLWCSPHTDLYGPGLAAHGLDPGRVILVRAPCDADILWAMEEGLRAPGIAAVVGEVGTFPAVASRRLQLAAERSSITALLLRRWRNGGQAARERALPNAATTRWRIAAMPSRPMRDEPGVGHPRWRVELLRCRGGEPACWEVEVADGTGHVSLAAALADRPAAPLSAEKSQAEKFRRAG